MTIWYTVTESPDGLGQELDLAAAPSQEASVPARDYTGATAWSWA
jgi:hypothetical protein